MISILQGTIDSRGADHVVVMTDGGVGFQVFVPSALAASIGANGGRVCGFIRILPCGKTRCSCSDLSPPRKERSF